MSLPNPMATPSLPSSWHMIRALGGVGVLCSLLIAVTFQQTLPIITRNKAEALQKAVFNVLPGATARSSFRLDSEGQIQPGGGRATHGDRLVYAGYDDHGDLVGIAIEASGQGFQDVIRLLYGYSPAREAVIGMEVLESKETPGLGDKILKDASFLANFEALDAALTAAGTLRNPIEVVKHGRKQRPWQIDGITGATISSVAVGAIIGASAEQTLPVLIGQMDRLRQIHHE